jgi:hypothetical protein
MRGLRNFRTTTVPEATSSSNATLACDCVSLPSLAMSLTLSSSFGDKTFSTAATDSGRAGSWLLNLVDNLDLHKVVLEAYGATTSLFSPTSARSATRSGCPSGQAVLPGLVEAKYEAPESARPLLQVVGL